MNSENESIRANPAAASPERPRRKSGSAALQGGTNASPGRTNASPGRRRQGKQEALRSTAQPPLPSLDSSPSPPAVYLSQSKKLGVSEERQQSQHGPETLQGEHLLDDSTADSPGTPEQLDAAQLGSALLSAWANSAALQHAPGADGAEEDALPDVHDSAHADPAPDLAQSPRPPVFAASPPSAHDTPDGALVAGATTPDPPDDATLRGSFASVTTGEEAFPKVRFCILNGCDMPDMWSCAFHCLGSCTLIYQR